MRRSMGEISSKLGGCSSNVVGGSPVASGVPCLAVPGEKRGATSPGATSPGVGGVGAGCPDASGHGLVGSDDPGRLGAAGDADGTQPLLGGVPGGQIGACLSTLPGAT